MTLIPSRLTNRRIVPLDHGVPTRPPPQRAAKRPPNYFGDTCVVSARRQAAVISEKSACPAKSLSSEKVAFNHTAPQRRWRFAFPVYVGVVLSPLIGCTVLPIAVYLGMGALPAAFVGLGIMALVMLGAAAVKFIEERESRVPRA